MDEFFKQAVSAALGQGGVAAILGYFAWRALKQQELREKETSDRERALVVRVQKIEDERAGDYRDIATNNTRAMLDVATAIRELKDTTSSLTRSIDDLPCADGVDVEARRKIVART